MSGRTLGMVITAVGASVMAWVAAKKTSDLLEKKRKEQLDDEVELIFKKMKDSNK